MGILPMIHGRDARATSTLQGHHAGRMPALRRPIFGSPIHNIPELSVPFYSAFVIIHFEDWQV